MLRLARILAALWAGSLCTICGIVAPTLFATLGDRHLAGQLAAIFFHIAAWLGIVFATGVMAAAMVRKSFRIDRLTGWIVGVSAALPLCSELLIGPLMDGAREGGDMRAFAAYHMIAGSLFLIACAGTLWLLWRVSRPAE
jgi:Domain of unknown function (DUF4149)